MNPTKCSYDPRSEKLDHMIQDARYMLQEEIENFSPKKDAIIDFIMENPDLSLTADQMIFLVQNSYPVVSPKRKDYYDVLARLVSEAKAIGDSRLVKTIYVLMPSFPTEQESQRKQAFFENGIQYFRSLGMHQIEGELYADLAGDMYANTADRIRFCESALELLDRTSRQYACVCAMRDMLGYMEHQGNQDFYHYWAFGGTVFSKGESIFLSPIFPCMAYRKRADALCFDVVILKGYREWYETMDSLDLSGEVKEVADEVLSVGDSKYLAREMELIRQSDETVTCQADGKEYLCRVFSIRLAENNGARIMMGNVLETHYYASGIGPIRSVISMRGREGVREYVFDLCDYTIKGGDGLLPCFVGNRWCYRQEDCPDEIDQVIQREIIAQNGEDYLLSGWNYAGRKPGSSCDGNNQVSV